MLNLARVIEVMANKPRFTDGVNCKERPEAV